jgi:hemoglobin-like flavoprotein
VLKGGNSGKKAPQAEPLSNGFARGMRMVEDVLRRGYAVSAEDRRMWKATMDALAASPESPCSGAEKEILDATPAADAAVEGSSVQPKQKQGQASYLVDAATIDAVRASWAAVKDSTTLSNTLFRHLFKLMPQLQGSLFESSNFKNLAVPFMASLGEIVAALDADDQLTEALETLAVRHRGYGVTVDHFGAFGAALLSALSHCSGGSGLSMAARAAWEATFDVCATIMSGTAAWRGAVQSPSPQVLPLPALLPLTPEVAPLAAAPKFVVPTVEAVAIKKTWASAMQGDALQRMVRSRLLSATVDIDAAVLVRTAATAVAYSCDAALLFAGLVPLAASSAIFSTRGAAAGAAAATQAVDIVHASVVDVVSDVSDNERGSWEAFAALAREAVEQARALAATSGDDDEPSASHVAFDDKTRSVVQETWGILSIRCEGLGDYVFRHMERAAPTLCSEWFVGVSYDVQYKWPYAVVHEAIEAMEDGEQFVTELVELALRYVRHGVSAAYLPLFKDAMLSYVGEYLPSFYRDGDAAATEVRSAWTKLLSSVTSVMDSALRDTRSMQKLHEYAKHQPTGRHVSFASMAVLREFETDADADADDNGDDVKPAKSPIDTIASAGWDDIDVNLTADIAQSASLTLNATLLASGTTSISDGASPTARSQRPLQDSLRTSAELSSAADDIEVARFTLAMKRIVLPPSVLMSMTTPDFNIFSALRKYAASNALDFAAKVVIELFRLSDLPARTGVKMATITRFVLACRKLYRPRVKYHNFFHAVDVTQTMYTYLYAGNVSKYFTDYDCFTMLVTALVHDLDHTGVNNAFHLKAKSPWGILGRVSEQKSVLEFRHCNLAVDVLERVGLFATWPPLQRDESYELLIRAILATDMGVHNVVVERFEELLPHGGESYDADNFEHRAMVASLVMKATDISNVAKPHIIAKSWAAVVTTEFYYQGDLERERNLDVVANCDRTLNTPLGKGQLGFINFLADPYFDLLVVESGLFSEMQWTVDNIAKNIELYNKELAEAKKMIDKATPAN